MEPYFTKNDKLLFYKYLDKSNYYFEFGSGGSTYQASIRNNIKKIYSVESDNYWHNILKYKIKSDKIKYICSNLLSKPKSWGKPGKDCSDLKKINYSNQILNLENPKELDLILIDGRFRVACCLKCFNLINENCIVIFDDFLIRNREYGIILYYFDIIEKSEDCKMVVLKKKDFSKKNNEIKNKYDNILKNLIKKYELIHI